MNKWVRPIVIGTGAFLGVSVALAILGSAMTGYGAARRESISQRTELAQSVQTSATALHHALRINVAGLTPGAQLVDRCDNGALPPLLEAKHAEVCADAALEEVKEEQDQSNVVRSTGDDARALQRQLRTGLEEQTPSQEWAAVVSAFSALSGLESSTRCGPDRPALVASIVTPTDGVPANVVDSPTRSDLLDSTLKGELQRVFPQSLTATSQIDPNITVREALIGDTTADDTGRCDHHGPAFEGAYSVVADELQDEARVIGDHVLDAHAANLDDTVFDVGWSLLTNPFFMIAAAVAIAAWAYTQTHPKPKEPTEVKIVDGGE